MNRAAPDLVDTPSAVADLCDRLVQADRVGVDTEFHSERRYSPELMLIQLATIDGRCWLVDPKAVDIRPIAEALSGLIWTAFAGASDLRLLHKEGAKPAVVQDPQRLAALAGYAYPRSLADLCHLELNIAVEKLTTMTDWSKRPLTQNQLRYAADDARLAIQLWDALESRLPPERTAWVIEDGAREIAALGQTPDSDAHWTKLRIASRLDAQSRAALSRLSAWREELAARQNQPPWSILPDAQMLFLARRRPASVSEINQHRRFHRGLVRKHGPLWLELIHAPPTAETPPQPPADRELRLATLTLVAHAVATSVGVAPAYLLPPDIAHEVANRGPEVLSGWRASLLQDPLEKLSQGRLALTTGNGSAQLQPVATPP